MTQFAEVGTRWLALYLLPLSAMAACATHPMPSALPRSAQHDDVAVGAVLPIRKIRFYESGIAQFERSGQLRQATTLLPLPVSDIDDALRTLTIRRGLDLVPDYSAKFETVILTKAARVGANLPAEPNLGFEYSDFVQSLRGERVELTVAGKRVQGRLVELVPVEIDSTKSTKDEAPANAKKTPSSKTRVANPKAATEADKSEWREFELTILTSQGEIERYPTSKVSGLRAMDTEVASRLETAVATTSGRAYETSRCLRISGQAGESVNLMYVAQVPLARITYRLHTGKSSNLDTLKGLALFHNDTDEAWNSVTIEISNEDLDSSVVSLAAPRYWDRPIHATRESDAAVVPQLKKQNADSLKESTANPRVARTPASPPATLRRPPKLGRLNAPRLPQNTQREGTSGHLSYTYTVAAPATLLAHSSALLPFVETTVKTERGVWFGGSSKVGRAVVRIQNTSLMPLPPGMLSIFDGDRFRGETELTPLEPGRYGYFDYANEPGLELKQKGVSESTLTYRSVTWSNDALQTRWTEQLPRTVELTNASNQALTAYVSISALDGATVKGVDGVDTDFTGRPIIAIIKVPANTHVERTIMIEQTQSDSDDVDSLDLDKLTLISQQTSLPAATRAPLAEAIKILNAKQAMGARKEQIDQDVSQLEETINRLPVSDTSHPVPGPIAVRFLQLEAERTQLQKQAAMLEKSAEQQGALVKKALSKLPQK